MDKIKLHKSNVPPTMNFDDILESRIVSNGTYVRMLEDKLKEIHKVKYALCFSNATTALFSLLSFYNTQKQRGVKTIAIPAFIWKSDKILLENLGFNVKYMDVDEKTYLVTEQTQKELNDEVDLFILESTFGSKPIVVYPQKTIIDSAHCAGSSEFGNLGLAEFISFSPSKTFTACEGGALLINDEYIYLCCKNFRDCMGRMSEINAKIVLNMLDKRELINILKQKINDIYRKYLGEEYFQVIPKYSTYNEITYRDYTLTEKQMCYIQDHLELRKRFNPCEYLYLDNSIGNRKNILKIYEDVVLTIDLFKYNDVYNSNKIYDKIFTLPSYVGCDPFEVINLIKKAKRNDFNDI